MVFPLLIAAAVGAAGAIGAGIIGANAAEKAAATQAAAADRATAVQEKGLAFQERQFDTARTDAMPWMEAGKKGLDAYLGELGLGSVDFQSKFTETPGYNFAVEEGEKGVVGNLNKLGMKNSGAALKALTRFRQGLASQEYGTYLDRLSGVAGAGQNQVNQTNALGANTAANMSNTSANIGRSIMDSGEATASGYIGGANAWTNAISNFTNTTGRALGRYDNSWNYVGG